MWAMAWFLALTGHPRVAGVLILQWLFGLRPMEAVSLYIEHLIVDDQCLPNQVSAPTVLLRPKEGTKVGRPQFVIAPERYRALASTVLRHFRRTTPRGSRLSEAVTTERYAQLFGVAVRGLHLNGHFTPHSPRAGWATELRIANYPFGELLELGRWESAKSLRTYLDVAAILSMQVSEPHVRYIAEWLLADLGGRFPWWQ